MDTQNPKCDFAHRDAIFQLKAVEVEGTLPVLVSGSADGKWPLLVAAITCVFCLYAIGGSCAGLIRVWQFDGTTYVPSTLEGHALGMCDAECVCCVHRQTWASNTPSQLFPCSRLCTVLRRGEWSVVLGQPGLYHQGVGHRVANLRQHHPAVNNPGGRGNHPRQVQQGARGCLGHPPFAS